MLECDPVSLGVHPVSTAHPAMSLSVDVSLLNVAWRLWCQGQWSPRGVRLLTPCGLPNVQTAPLYHLHSACRMIKDKSPLTICLFLYFFFFFCCVPLVVLLIFGLMDNEKNKQHESFCFSGVVYLFISCVWGLPLCYPLWPFQREFLCGATADPQVQHYRGQQDTSRLGEY